MVFVNGDSAEFLSHRPSFAPAKNEKRGAPPKMSAERRTEADRHDTSFRESALRDERKKKTTRALLIIEEEKPTADARARRRRLRRRRDTVNSYDTFRRRASRGRRHRVIGSLYSVDVINNNDTIYPCFPRSIFFLSAFPPRYTVASRMPETANTPPTMAQRFVVKPNTESLLSTMFTLIGDRS